MLLGLVACVTTGKPWPDGTPGLTKPASVVMLTAEDSLDDTIKPRVLAAGGDCDRVHVLQSIHIDEKTKRAFLLGEDLAELERVIAAIGDVALVTIDPITAYMGKIDSHKSTDVRGQLGPLKDLAEKTNVAFSAITHPPKASSQRAIDHFIGSQAFVAAARLGHLCVAELDENDEETGRILIKAEFGGARSSGYVPLETDPLFWPRCVPCVTPLSPRQRARRHNGFIDALT